MIGRYVNYNFGDNGKVYSTDGIAPTLSTAQGGGRTPTILIKNATKTGYTEAKVGDGVDLAYPNSKTRRGRVQSQRSNTLTTSDNLGVVVKATLTPDRINKRQNGRRFKENGEPSFTLTVADRQGVLIDDGTELRIRKLTPRECWRLQGFTDEQFDKVREAGLSDSQLYKQAGNAVSVPVVYDVVKEFAVGEDVQDEELFGNEGVTNF